MVMECLGSELKKQSCHVRAPVDRLKRTTPEAGFLLA